jgi:putative NIF3 family GTP cyclohydrolase 1 type 2
VDFIWEKRSHWLLPCVLVFMGLPAVGQEQLLTARQVVERIQQHVGVSWREQTVDTFKAGNPDTPVKGIATTMMATFDVLRRAAEAGDNFIITHEPTFYNHLDKTADFEREHDAVFNTKRAFIQKHGLVVFRFHDHWHARRPDGIQTGMIHALGWEKFQNPENNRLFAIPPTTVGQLAASIKKLLGIRTLRVVGDPDMKISKIALNPGYPGFPAERHTLQRDDVEALVMGEGLEWETIEYGADAVAEGKHKALIILGHIPSEQAGMQECATWLKTFLPGVRIDFVPAQEPFWSPR